VATCGFGPVAAKVPPDAQVARIRVTSGTISLVPDAVRAGVVYVVLEPPTDSVQFLQSAPEAGAEPGPLTADDVARLARGDTEGTAMSGFDLLGCDANRRVAERDRLKVPGGCGDTFRMELRPGLVAFTPDAVEVQDGTVEIAVLTVRP
jgi:hypothetical protein